MKCCTDNVFHFFVSLCKFKGWKWQNHNHNFALRKSECHTCFWCFLWYKEEGRGQPRVGALSWHYIAYFCFPFLFFLYKCLFVAVFPVISQFLTPKILFQEQEKESKNTCPQVCLVVGRFLCPADFWRDHLGSFILVPNNYSFWE